MKSSITVLGTLLLVAGATAVQGCGTSDAGTEAVAAEGTAVVRRGDLVIVVAESGYLKAKNSVNLRPQFAREGTITWLVKEGKSVETGEVLVEFDKTDLQTQFDDKSNELRQFRTELVAAQAEQEIQQRDSTAAVEKAEFEFQVARMKLELYEKGEGPNELRKKRLAAEKAHSELERAKERFDKVPELRKEGFLTKIQEEEERIALREKEIEVENADKDLELHQTYTQPMGLVERQNGVKDAERNLTNARARSDIQLKEKEGRIAETAGKVKSTEARLAKLERDIGFMTIKAPRAGIVYYGDPGEPWMRDDIKVGNRISQGNMVVTLPDLGEMQVMLQVHEADIDLVKVGQLVLVTLESVQARVFQAKVTRIGAVANQNWGNPENKTFEIETTMEPTDIDLRAGTTAKAELQVETVADALQIPIHAVFAEADEHFVFVAQGRGFAKHAVKIGKHNNHFVQVLDGLRELEQVLLYDPRAAGLSEGSPQVPAAAAAPKSVVSNPGAEANP
jgi:RND family efflux transporter MFP subunit